ncbi:MAG: CD1871A family CXXC motif-containing protein [Fastidiosipilaceae bacterium]|nr:hypothetical protein [Clostridiaceae bacterium]
MSKKFSKKDDQAIQGSQHQGSSPDANVRKKSSWKRPIWLPILLFVIGLVCIGIAFPLGDVRLMFQKAIYICLECIGLG